MTGSSANKMVSGLTRNEVTAAMVPVCLDVARNDPDRIAQLAIIRAASHLNCRDAVMATGWATIPGAGTPNRDLAQACMEVPDLDAS